MLVLPPDLAFEELLVVTRRRWWLGDFRDQISRGSLCYTIDEHPEKRYLHHDGKRHGESKKHSTSIDEPDLLLLFVEPHTMEVWLEKLPHQTSGREVGL